VSAQSIDTEALRRRRAELGLSVRQLCAVVGMTTGGYLALEKGTAGTSITFGVAGRLAEALGLGLDELAGRTHVPVPELAEDDAARLGALLTATGTLTPVGTICEVLDWPTERLHTAEAELGRRLVGVGMRLRRSVARLSIVRGESALDPEVVKTAVRRHLNRDHLSLTEARLLRHVQHDDVPTQPSNHEKVALGVLVNASLVDFGPAPAPTAEAPIVLSDDVRFSLMLDEVPMGQGPSPTNAPRPRRSPATAPGGPGRPRRGQPIARPTRSSK
jgi:transcriptional regulator with XRE-family HTH domain